MPHSLCATGYSDVVSEGSKFKIIESTLRDGKGFRRLRRRSPAFAVPSLRSGNCMAVPTTWQVVYGNAYACADIYFDGTHDNNLGPIATAVSFFERIQAARRTGYPLLQPQDQGTRHRVVRASVCYGRTRAMFSWKCYGIVKKHEDGTVERVNAFTPSDYLDLAPRGWTPWSKSLASKSVTTQHRNLCPTLNLTAATAAP
ncbi:unnamed protein product [Tilletia controversa]|nr:unnamed protein product [Tilletia controversa]